MKEKMNLTKSKRFLADAIHASGKGWMDVATHAAQDRRTPLRGLNIIVLYNNKPDKPISSSDYWGANTTESDVAGYIKCDKLSPNWHQTILSREEYFSAYPAEPAVEPVADADGWIAHDGAKCPVATGVAVDVKYKDGGVMLNLPANLPHHTRRTAAPCWWDHDGMAGDIIAYRLHKPDVKSTAVGDDETNIAAKEELEAMDYKPSIEQLMQTYADRAHSLKLASEHLEVCTKQAGEAMKALSSACKDAGFDILPINAKPDPDLVITDWLDLRLGDVIWVGGYDEHRSGECVVIELEDRDYRSAYAVKTENSDAEERWIDVTREWRFIRRP